MTSYAADAETSQSLNPRIILAGEGSTESGTHRTGNIYAPEVLLDEGLIRMWYGGQGSDGHDRIHLAESRDGITWHRHGVVLDESPEVNHINDPSIVKIGSVYWMFYTRAQVSIADEIALAISTDGVNWRFRGVVLGPGEVETWNALVVSRPSVLFEEGMFKMWYDARGLKPDHDRPTTDRDKDWVEAATERAVGYAVSSDGLHWEQPIGEPVFRHGAGAVHVKRVDDENLVMVFESSGGTRYATSKDGLNWMNRGFLAKKSGDDTDRDGHVTPFLFCDGKNHWQLFFGAPKGDWSRNSIATLTLPDHWQQESLQLLHE